MSGRYSHVTFEEYVEQRWDMADSRARQLILAANVTDELKSVKNLTVLPSRESHAKELLHLESDNDRAAVSSSTRGREGPNL